MALPTGNYDLEYSNQQTDQAKSGDIKTGMMFNTSSAGSIGTIKILALAGLGWVIYKIFGDK